MSSSARCYCAHHPENVAKEPLLARDCLLVFTAPRDFPTMVLKTPSDSMCFFL